MFLSPRISLSQLAELCRRLAMASQSGIDARTIWSREVQRAHGRGRRAMATVADAVQRGDSLADGLDATSRYFPLLFRELSRVGELTGHQPEVFGQLADHYQHQISLRRSFLASISWPIMELAIAIAIIGLLIFVMGIINDMNHTQIDPLGLGLIGTRGLAIYAAVIGGAGLTIWLLITAVRRGVVWTRPIQRAVLRVPGLGSALNTLALARLAWAMHLTFGTGLEVRRALKISLESAGNARYLGHIKVIDAAIAEGESVYEAFCRTADYPADFLDSLAISEQSGRLSESLALLSQQYQQRARAALGVLTQIAGFLVWAVVAAMIVVMIFRLFGFYIGQLREAMPK